MPMIATILGFIPKTFTLLQINPLRIATQLGYWDPRRDATSERTGKWGFRADFIGAFISLLLWRV